MASFPEWLLWAKKLSNEHQHLTTRLREVEAECLRLKAAEQKLLEQQANLSNHERTRNDISKAHQVQDTAAHLVSGVALQVPPSFQKNSAALGDGSEEPEHQQQQLQLVPESPLQYMCINKDNDEITEDATTVAPDQVEDKPINFVPDSEAISKDSVIFHASLAQESRSLGEYLIHAHNMETTREAAMVQSFLLGLKSPHHRLAIEDLLSKNPQPNAWQSLHTAVTKIITDIERRRQKKRSLEV